MVILFLYPKSINTKTNMFFATTTCEQYVHSIIFLSGVEWEYSFLPGKNSQLSIFSFNQLICSFSHRQCKELHRRAPGQLSLSSQNFWRECLAWRVWSSEEDMGRDNFKSSTSKFSIHLAFLLCHWSMLIQLEKHHQVFVDIQIQGLCAVFYLINNVVILSIWCKTPPCVFHSLPEIKVFF